MPKVVEYRDAQFPGSVELWGDGQYWGSVYIFPTQYRAGNGYDSCDYATDMMHIIVTIGDKQVSVYSLPSNTAATIQNLAELERAPF